MNESITQKFLRRVRSRQNLVSFAGRLQSFFLIAICGYALVLLLSRFFGFLSNWFKPLTLVIPPVIALILAWMFYRRPKVAEAARLADAKLATHDLFLT